MISRLFLSLVVATVMGSAGSAWAAATLVNLKAIPFLRTVKSGGTTVVENRATLSVDVGSTGGVRTTVKIYYDADPAKLTGTPAETVAHVTGVLSDGDASGTVTGNTPTVLVHGTTYFFKAVATTGSETSTTADGPSFVQNVAPIAQGKTVHATKAFGTPAEKVLVNILTPPRPGVNALAYDPDGDALAISSVATPIGTGTPPPPPEGTAAVVGDSVEYTPGNTFDGNDQFTYTVKENVPANPALILTASAVVQIVNNAPTARDDRATVRRTGGDAIDVLSNDFDKDRDLIRLRDFTQPAHGRVTVVGTKFRFVASSTFTGLDQFTYTIEDTYGKTATATVLLFAPEVAVKGSTGVALKDADGKVVGYLRIETLANGTFTARIEIGAKKYRLMGSLDANGTFTGMALDGDGGGLPLALGISLNESGEASLSADVGAGKYTADQTLKTLTGEGLAAAEGRYTVELPPGSGTTTTGSDGTTTLVDGTTTTDTTTTTDGTTTTTASGPDGTGWMTIKIDANGNAGIKGKMGDGRAFSAKAVLGGSDSAPELIIFATPRSSIVAGTIKVGDTITGELQWSRPQTDATFYPEGFDLPITATGGRWTKPESGQRSLASSGSDAGRGTIAISGGDVTGFTRNVRFSEGDRVQILDPGDDDIGFKIHRKDGTFSGAFASLDDENKHIRFTGVLLQGETSSGVGVFQGHDRAGTVKIALTTATDSSTGSGSSTGGTGSTGSTDTTGSTDLSGLTDLTGIDTSLLGTETVRKRRP